MIINQCVVIKSIFLRRDHIWFGGLCIKGIMANYKFINFLYNLKNFFTANYRNCTQSQEKVNEDMIV